MKEKNKSLFFYILSIIILGIYFIFEISSKIILSENGRIILLSVSCLFIYFGGRYMSKYRNDNKPMIINLYIFFALYLLLLLTLTMFDSMWGRSGININISNLSNMKQNINLIPFKTISEYIREFNSMYSTRNVLFNLIGNIVAFMPFAFFLPILYKKQNKFKIFLLTMIIIICDVELLQLVTGSGRLDIDDLILNLSGAIIMFLIIKIESIIKSLKNIFLLEKNKLSSKDVKIIISLFFVIFVLLMGILILRNRMYNNNINEYNLKMNPKIVLIDESEVCDTSLEKFYENELYEYYFPCIKSEYVFVTINDKEKYKIKEILENNKGYNIDIYKIENSLDYYNISYIRKEKYEKISFNINLEKNGNNLYSPNCKFYIGNEKILSARFDGKSSNLDFDNSKYSIDLYLIPKNAGTSNIEVFFEDDSNELIKKYLYSIIIDNDYNVTYNLLEEK